MDDWETDVAEAQLPAVRRRDNFVAPIAKLDTLPAWMSAQPHELASPPTVQEIVQYTATPVERAKAFHITSLPVAVAFGFTAFLIAVLAFGNPWLSAPSLITAFVVFVVAWVVMLVVDGLRSPEGVVIVRELGTLHLIRREQDARHDYIRFVTGMPQKEKGRKGKR
jgi:hypothetical protein